MLTRLLLHSLIIFTTFLLRCSAYNVVNLFDAYLFLPLVLQWSGQDYLNVRGDLLISSGADAPFLLYRLYAFLISHGYNQSSILGTTYFISYALTYCAIYLLFKTFLKSQTPSMLLSSIFFLLPGSFFTINWNIFPVQAPTSSSLGIPFALLSYTFALRGLILGSATCAVTSTIFHPAFGLLGSLFSATILFTRHKSSRSKKLLIKNLLTILIPTFLSIILITGVSRGLSNYDKTDFFTGIKQYADHIFPAIHMREGYGVFFFILISANIFATRHRKLSKTLIPLTALSTLLLVISILNSYLEFSSGITLLYLSRAFVLLEPLVFLSLLSAFSSEVSIRSNLVHKLLLLCLVLLWIFLIMNRAELITSDQDKIFLPIISISLLTAAILNRAHPSIFISVFFISLISIFGLFGDEATASLVGMLISVLMYALYCCIWNRYLVQRSTKPTMHHGLIILIFILIILPLNIASLGWPSFEPDCSEGLGQAPFEWIRKNINPASLFIINPSDFYLGLKFRYCTRRGLYISRPDINQIAYTPRDYSLARRRMTSLGVILKGQRRSTCQQNIHVDSLLKNIFQPAEEIISAHPTHVLVRRSESDITILKDHIVYEDNEWIVAEIDKVGYLNEEFTNN